MSAESLEIRTKFAEVQNQYEEGCITETELIESYVDMVPVRFWPEEVVKAFITRSNSDYDQEFVRLVRYRRAIL